ncbi:DUF1194 domain-containing protein [Defluviimonas sp. WL0002]|uniref:DUF1194 domain-containing protein n=1 Tax=Albidovulum marisflavi TaxID=2984159 RepID=A0ABT2ZHC3_9RHOB|nr:DUF1194 domain-containing protein [Defluviimonas sp. WL0002]MCV2870542.1 DUF1194 domain-containing protein [Defluviimonas sp. WL0002]
MATSCALFASLLILTAPAARACEVALMLAIDVSGSIDAGEYRIQIDGTADALSDPAVVDALVLSRARVAMVQWSAGGMQALSLGWRNIEGVADARALADEIRTLPRAFSGADTAVGEAIGFAAEQFASVADCRRHVIDISGDGAQNAGRPLEPHRARALKAGIEINAIAIESIGLSITVYYRSFVISPGGFVVTARGFSDYPQAIRMKLLREIGQPLG